MSIQKSRVTPALASYSSWIEGRELEPSSRTVHKSINPATGSAWAKVFLGTPEDLNVAVASAQKAFSKGSWGRMSPAERRHIILNFASVIEENAEHLAQIESIDAGKLLKETRLHVAACVEWLRYFAGSTDKFLGQTIPAGRNVLNYTIHQPYGVIGAIIPSNSPLILAFWKIAPALATGNCLVIKPSENTSASLIEIMRLTRDVLPPGVINVITGLGAEMGHAIAAHPGIGKVVFTGGMAGGTAVAVATAKRLVPSVLELGGKSANIVFADAAQEKAIGGLMAGVFAASGQTCMAGSRVLIEREIYEDVLSKLVNKVSSIRLGDPLNDATDVGPLGSLTQLERVEGLVERAVKRGATVHVGGSRAKVSDCPGGYFFAPTILSGVENDWEIACEEIFGPVMTVMAFDSEDQALNIANDSAFGLVAGVWTTNLSRAHRLAEALEVGTVFINLYRKVLPQSPFGGWKNSGLGRENGFEVLGEYTQGKSILMDLDDEKVQEGFLMRVGEEN